MGNAKLENMSIRISIFYTLPVFLLTFLTSLFSQTNSIDSLISVYKNDDQNPINIIKIGEAYAAEKKWDLAINFYKKLVRICLLYTSDAADE